MRYPNNIESSKYGKPYRVGYRKSDGKAVRIFGDSRRRYRIAEGSRRTLKEISELLETL